MTHKSISHNKGTQGLSKGIQVKIRRIRIFAIKDRTDMEQSRFKL